ncbi:MAG: hypothetical protein AABZ55_15710 [Bdellovibrionota bacterium]
MNILKYLSFGIALVFVNHISAFAHSDDESLKLTCSTLGSAIDVIAEFNFDHAAGTLEVYNSAGDLEQVYGVELSKEEVAALTKGTEVTLMGKTSKSQSNAGATTQAVLFNIGKAGKSSKVREARFAKDSIVYTLTCR